MSLETNGTSSGIVLTHTGIKAILLWVRLTSPSATAKTWCRWSDETVQDKQNHVLRTNTAVTTNNYLRMQSTPGTQTNSDLGAGYTGVWANMWGIDDGAGLMTIGLRLENVGTYTTFTKSYTTPSDVNSFSALYDGANGVDFTDNPSRVTSIFAWSTAPTQAQLFLQSKTKELLFPTGILTNLRCNVGDTIGVDQSGAGNNWTVTGSGLSLVSNEPIMAVSEVPIALYAHQRVARNTNLCR
jgi:hypothetical protein